MDSVTSISALLQISPGCYMSLRYTTYEMDIVLKSAWLLHAIDKGMKKDLNRLQTHHTLKRLSKYS